MASYKEHVARIPCKVGWNPALLTLASGPCLSSVGVPRALHKH